MDVEEWVEYILNDPQAVKALKALGVAASVVTLYKLAGYALRELVLVPTLTVLRDVEDLHKPRKGGKIPGRVVICGGRWVLVFRNVFSCAPNVLLSPKASADCLPLQFAQTISTPF